MCAAPETREHSTIRYVRTRRLFGLDKPYCLQ